MQSKRTDRSYENELRQVRERLLIMAGRVESMLERSIEALVEQNLPLAESTIRQDRLVNQDEVETDELCLLILAKRQPMAKDLRFITQALKMVTDLERIGDLAVNICERVLDLADQPPPKPYRDIPKMASIVQAMIRDAVDSLVDNDVEKAKEVIRRDDEVDGLYIRIFKDLIAIMMKNESKIPACIHVQSVAKVLERIADHCTNLAETVIFMVHGLDIRHEGKLVTN